uniref:UORF n=1 Tax=Trypanosoma cruzi TaxID=5693 RepID=A0A076JRF3_TRYCR|nr:uORF [Trypanosoma cruzi]AII77638.1 uORF [Trypanosoma cruzi]AII77643.1 uORF [Trypanosoma cruzi]AII77648.1 uORF [Trypanosoma cruzi]
MRCQCYRRPRD